ncbi:MAG: SdpI family protein [Clostridia bacterium]|nr:SdpI family protein [Clostridia bacterium]
MKKNKWLMVVTSIIILLPILGGVLLWDKLPERVPFHWGVDGEVDGWASKPMAVFGLPPFMLAIQWICILATGLEPKAKNVTTTKMLGLVLWIIPVLNLFLHVMVYLAAFGRKVDMAAIMPLFMGALFVVMGNYLPKCKQSYTMGIKLPWTLNDEGNWNATHRLAGKIWVAGGLLTMPCALLSGVWAFIVMMSILVVMCAVPTVYSYRYYKQHKKEE